MIMGWGGGRRAGNGQVGIVLSLWGVRVSGVVGFLEEVVDVRLAEADGSPYPDMGEGAVADPPVYGIGVYV